MLKMWCIIIKKSKQVEPILCKKPWLKAVDHNLAGGAASSRGLLYLLVPFLILKTDVFLLWHMGGTSLHSRDAGVCVQMGFSDMSLLLKLVCDTGTACNVLSILTRHQSCPSAGTLAFKDTSWDAHPKLILVNLVQSDDAGT